MSNTNCTIKKIHSSKSKTKNLPIFNILSLYLQILGLFFFYTTVLRLINNKVKKTIHSHIAGENVNWQSLAVRKKVNTKSFRK